MTDHYTIRENIERAADGVALVFRSVPLLETEYIAVSEYETELAIREILGEIPNQEITQ